jgi:hypothetical protein
VLPAVPVIRGAIGGGGKELSGGAAGRELLALVRVANDGLLEY